MPFAPETITKPKRLDPGHLVVIELTLPPNLTINGKEHLVQHGIIASRLLWSAEATDGSIP